jgi:hypothetical protein
MSDGNFGGGGSVYWATNSVDTTGTGGASRQKRKSRLIDQLERKGTQEVGADYLAEEVGDFTVSLVIPDRNMRHCADFIAWLLKDGNLDIVDGRVEFRLPVNKTLEGLPDDEKTQIRVSWGERTAMPGIAEAVAVLDDEPAAV